jgi:GNAT superfamily N-acetyltransferase
MVIKIYDESRDYPGLLTLFASEEDWACYSGDNAPRYKNSLAKSITHVAYEGNELVGYSRSIEDFGFYILICDLLVHRKHRGKSIGKKLLECVANEYQDMETFVLSDVDLYYKKLGYEVEGTVFKVPVDSAP